MRIQILFISTVLLHSGMFFAAQDKKSVCYKNDNYYQVIDSNSASRRQMNTIHVMRGMIHNHPKLASYLLDEHQQRPQFPQDYCWVAMYVLQEHNLWGSLDTFNLKKASESLKKDPITEKPFCDGSSCSKLLKDSEPYVLLYCKVCAMVHQPTDYCRCPCSPEPDCQKDNKKHVYAECQGNGRYIDYLVKVSCQARKSFTAASSVSASLPNHKTSTAAIATTKK